MRDIQNILIPKYVDLNFIGRSNGTKYVGSLVIPNSTSVL